MLVTPLQAMAIQGAGDEGVIVIDVGTVGIDHAGYDGQHRLRHHLRHVGHRNRWR